MSSAHPRRCRELSYERYVTMPDVVAFWPEGEFTVDGILYRPSTARFFGTVQFAPMISLKEDMPSRSDEAHMQCHLPPPTDVEIDDILMIGPRYRIARVAESEGES